MNIIIYFDCIINNVDPNIYFKCLKWLEGGYNRLESSQNFD